jgi:hypothetical protein
MFKSKFSSVSISTPEYMPPEILEFIENKMSAAKTQITMPMDTSLKMEK